MNAFWKWLRAALPIAALAVLATAAILMVDPPQRRGMSWLIWTTLFVSISSSSAGSRRCCLPRWLGGR